MDMEWRQFELAVTQFCRALAPEAKVTHDAVIPDIDTGTPRQRDVWIEASIGNFFPVKILVSCKRYKRRLNIQDIDAFIGELISSGAQKGVIYSLNGFTKTAIEKAQVKGISCCILLKGKPPPIPNLLSLRTFFAREELQIFEENSNSEFEFSDLLEVEVPFEGNVLPAFKIISKYFDHDKNELISKDSNKLPYVLIKITVAENSLGKMVSVGVRNTWIIYMAENGAHLVNGSYSFTESEFRGSMASPAIDTWSDHPGDGWKLSSTDELYAGNFVRFVAEYNSVEPVLSDYIKQNRTTVTDC
ncbi:restriction endonuclease [Novosphingobium sp.]|uniref:restriction endonuclease n=1 Tax=Novosphingobium sp. TaxID=1874826 RepID=UPI003BAB596B